MFPPAKIGADRTPLPVTYFFPSLHCSDITPMCFSNLSYQRSQRSTDVSIGNAEGKTERTQTGVKTSVIIAEGKNIHHSLQPFRLLSENQSSLLVAAIPLYTEPPAEPIKEARQRPDSTPVFGVLFTCAEIEKRFTETRSRRRNFCVPWGLGRAPTSIVWQNG